MVRLDMDEIHNNTSVCNLGAEGTSSSVVVKKNPVECLLDRWRKRSAIKKEHGEATKDVNRSKEQALVVDLQRRYVEQRIKQAEHAAKSQQQSLARANENGVKEYSGVTGASASSSSSSAKRKAAVDPRRSTTTTANGHPHLHAPYHTPPHLLHVQAQQHRHHHHAIAQQQAAAAAGAPYGMLPQQFWPTAAAGTANGHMSTAAIQQQQQQQHMLQQQQQRAAMQYSTSLQHQQQQQQHAFALQQQQQQRLKLSSCQGGGGQVRAQQQQQQPANVSAVTNSPVGWPRPTSSNGDSVVVAGNGNAVTSRPPQQQQQQPQQQQSQQPTSGSYENLLMTNIDASKFLPDAQSVSSVLEDLVEAKHARAQHQPTATNGAVVGSEPSPAGLLPVALADIKQSLSPPDCAAPPPNTQACATTGPQPTAAYSAAHVKHQVPSPSCQQHNAYAAAAQLQSQSAYASYYSHTAQQQQQQQQQLDLYAAQQQQSAAYHAYQQQQQQQQQYGTVYGQPASFTGGLPGQHHSAAAYAYPRPTM